MKYVKKLSEDELNTLISMHENHPSQRVRKRAFGIILSNKGYPIQEIASILHVTRQTVSSWIDNWEQIGITGLYDNLRSGCPRKLSPEDEEFLKKLIEKEPRSVKKVIASLEEVRDKKVSESTIKRSLKRSKKVWKRVRKSLKSKRNEEKFQSSKKKIQKLEELRKQGLIDIFYFDEAGFSLEPYIPYAWQPIGEVIEVLSSKSSRLNVLGFMNKNNILFSYIFKGSITTDVVIACFDEFCKKLSQKCVVIIDNAPIHKSKKFSANIAKWYQKGLVLKFLPTYSPELNLIEILWKKIKYEWLPFSAYLSFKNLQNALESILKNFGSEYTINFAS